VTCKYLIIGLTTKQDCLLRKIESIGKSLETTYQDQAGTVDRLVMLLQEHFCPTYHGVQRQCEHISSGFQDNP